MAEWKAKYTPEEDATVLEYAKEALDEGIPLETAFMKAADKLGRPPGSVSNRYNRLKTKANGEIKTLTDGERIILKLKSLKREKDRNAEKSDMYKERYEELEDKCKALEKRYGSLESEYNKLLNTLKDALGEEAL